MRQHRTGRRVLGCLTAAVLLVAGTPGIAYAYWVADDRTHSAQASGSVLPAGSVPDAPSATGRTVSVSFARLTSSAGSGSLELTSYRLNRYPAGSPADAPVAASTLCQASDGVLAQCAEDGVPDGNWTYTDQPVLANWTGPASARSASVTVDGTGPAVTIGSPADGGATDDSTPTITGSAGTASGDLATVTVRIYAGGSASGSALQTISSTPVNGSWAVTAAALTGNASYTVQASQRDWAGNLGQSSATFVLDTTAPVVGLTAPASPVNGTPTFAGSAGTVVASNTSSADSATIGVLIYAGSSVSGSPVQSLTATRSGAGWAVTSPGLGSGKYTAQASQADGAGNVSLSTARTFTVDASAPAIAVTSPADGGATDDSTPTIRGTAGTAPGDQNTITLSVYAGPVATGSPLQTLTSTASSGSWSATLAALAANRQYTVRASQADSYGNLGIADSTFVLDTVAPAVGLTSPAAGATTAATPTFTGPAGMLPGSATSSADGSTVTVRVYAGSSTGGSLVRTLTGTVVGGSYTVTSSALGSGSYTVQASQADAAGNVSLSPSSTFTVDGTAPAVSLKSLPGYLRDGTPTFSGAAGTASGDQSTITVSIYPGSSASGTPVQVLTTTRTGSSWTLLVFNALPGNAQYTAQASQQDAAGNLGLSVPRTFTVDTTAPQNLTISSPQPGDTGQTNRPTITGTAGVATETATTSADDGTVTVRIYRGTGTAGVLDQTLLPAVGAGGAWSVRVSNGSRLTVGQTYTVVVSQTDEVANSSTSPPVTFTA